MKSYLQGLLSETSKRVTCFSIALILTACSEEAIEEAQTVSVSQISARAIAGCELADNVDVNAYLIVGGERFLMTQSPDGGSASLTVDLTVGQSVVIEIVLLDNGDERIIARATGTAPESGNTLRFQENQFDLSCDTASPPIPPVPDAGEVVNSDDTDGDGVLDDIDPFIDLNSDGRDDITGLADVNPNPNVSEASPCGTESGTDNNSSNNNWDDNCGVRRTSRNGQFADSLYSVGIQRIIYCSGFGGDGDYAGFADGEFGDLTESALEEFQSSGSDPITVDGIVGPQTWAKLQSAIEKLAAGELSQGNGDSDATAQDTYGFTVGRCANIPLFYQTVTSVDGRTVELGGWTLARNQPNQAESIPFSINTPFGRL